MKITVTVADTNGTPQPDAAISINCAVKGPGLQVNERSFPLAAGAVLEVDLAATVLFVSVRPPLLRTETFTASLVGGAWLTDDPAVTVSGATDAISLAVVIGSVDFAPIVKSAGLKVTDNPQALYVQDAGGGTWIYRGGWLGTESMRILKEPVFGDPNGAGWARLAHDDPPPIDLSKRGSFVFLEHGPARSPAERLPRFLLLVWVPREPLGDIPRVVIFYSPTTTAPSYPADKYPFLGNYPYAFLMRNGKPKPPKQAVDGDATLQPYADLATNYLDVGYKIVYQILAAGRNPIVVMPIQASADWGPFSSVSGMGRATADIVRFLYARQLVNSRTTPSAKLSLSGAMATTFPPSGHVVPDHVPRRFAVTASGFSAGINAVVALCSSAALDAKKYPAAVFASNPSVFASAWTEIWDIDGVDSSGWAHLSSAFTGWRRGSRVLRSYHSQDTYNSAKGNTLIDAALIVRKSGSAGFVEEGTSKDGNTTWVHFSNGYIHATPLAPGTKDPDAAVRPSYGYYDAHHMVPALAFGHAARFAAR
ncbi:hypothetical protein ACFVWR_10595 [Leifsonia sp. NPDC058292]|uniref:hypothetical protein n=1 Tax=Leifsonia sp. NPDC058292 TaxID=3346428 RepID=UPI0036D79F14